MIYLKAIIFKKTENRELKKEAKLARRSDFQVKSEELDHQIADINDEKGEMIRKGITISTFIKIILKFSGWNWKVVGTIAIAEDDA
jgi:hypothetical protein